GRVERNCKRTAEELDGRHNYEPSEDATGKYHASDAGTDDVSNAEVFGRGVGPDCTPRVPGRLIVGGAGPESEEVFVLEKGIKTAQAKAGKAATGKCPAAITCNQDIRAGCALGIEEVAVFLHDQLPPQRNHEEDAQPSAYQGQEKDTRVFQREAHEDKGGYGKD